MNKHRWVICDGQGGRKFSWWISFNSSPGLFFRHRFNLKLDNPLCAHGDWGGRDGPWQSTSSLSFLVSVNRAFFYCYLHQLIPIILLFCLLALLPDAEVIWSRIYPSWQSNVSLICRDASRSFSHAPSSVQWAWHFAPEVLSHVPQVPVYPVSPTWPRLTPDAVIVSAQMFLNQASWGQVTPKSWQLRKPAWLVQTKKGQDQRPVGRQSKQLGLLNTRWFWLHCDLQVEPGLVLLISLGSTFPEEQIQPSG